MPLLAAEAAASGALPVPCESYVCDPEPFNGNLKVLWLPTQVTTDVLVGLVFLLVFL